MSVVAITDHYVGEALDQQANYGENNLLFIGWDEHLLFCSAKAYLFAPEMLFGELKKNILSDAFSQHPDFEHIKWDEVLWNLNDEEIHPQDSQTLAELGFDHKSLLRFKTPGLNGFNGTGV